MKRQFVTQSVVCPEEYPELQHVISIERQGEDLNMQAELEHRPDAQLEE
jgi:hypothetical protein